MVEGEVPIAETAPVQFKQEQAPPDPKGLQKSSAAAASRKLNRQPIKNLKVRTASVNDGRVVLPKERLCDKYKVFGKLKQSASSHFLCIQNDNCGALFMVKKTNWTEVDILKSLKHSSIIQPREAFQEENTIYLSLDFHRVTLKEALTTPAPITASHIYSTINFLVENGIVHNRIDAAAIRICGKTGRIILCDFQMATRPRSQRFPAKDFESLGMVLLEMMSEPRPRQYDLELARSLQKKLYGVDRPECWSHCNELIEFLEALITYKDVERIRRREHPYLRITDAEGGSFEAHVALVPFSCFSLWYAQKDGHT
ncbi:uncharacterized protein PV09_08055 [Verruconis gallopava]|uniref:Protein kinase domain-containing protein n=1 Tax=Verruconis gallopava TaxID=253628 RepID=A0A0D1YHL1_9PEZI|nr:uncharacterized protein PV09_08055 [Verruconis gallopava]KIW00342.1 hypothetical protein PV09_08055 [Verruconis gallopava]